MERTYNLGVTPPVPQAVAELQKQLRGGAAEETRHDPLRILHLVSRPKDVADPESDALQRSIDCFCSEGAIEREVLVTGDWHELDARLADRTRPLHFVHYDGPLVATEDGLMLLLAEIGGAGAPLSIAQLAQTMARSQIAALCLETRRFYAGDRFSTLPSAIAAAAGVAQQAGLTDLVATTEVLDAWSSSRCFQAVYDQLTAGVTLAEAVAAAEGPLAHHGAQPVRFFATAQARTGLEESISLGRARQRMFGFQSALLPPQASRISDGEALLVLDRLRRSQRALVITGIAGAGKTHLLHAVALHLAQQQSIDFAFCFDCAASPPTAIAILEMIAPVLGVTRGEASATRAALAKLHCCFVLDGLTDGSVDDELLRLLRELASDGHMVLVSGERPLAAAPELHEIAIAPLSLPELRILMARHAPTPATQDQAIDALLAATKGNPFLTMRAAALLAEQPISAVTSTIAASAHSPVSAFYGSQWRELPQHWRDLLLLCAGVDGLLLELVMIACDNKVAFAPARELLALLGAESTRFSDVITGWLRRGFVSRLPHGHFIDPHCHRFLAQQADELSPQARLCFSQTLCEGLRLLSEHLGRQSNPTLTYYLLNNRRQWVPHLERLWFAGDHRGFLSCKRAFDHLLRQGELGHESAAWSLDLLARSPLFRSEGDMLAEANLAWLALAASAVSAPGIDGSEAMSQGAALWQRWIESLPETLDKRNALAFQQAASFLDAYHRHCKRWSAAVAVSRLAQARYLGWQAWPALIQSLKALARCHVELGEPAEALGCEERILDDIPYADAPPGFEVQQLFDIAVTRAARGATAAAQAVLDRLRSHEQGQRLGDAISRLEAQIQSRERSQRT